MLFNSYEFIFLFLPITFFVYFYLLNKRLITGAKGFLVFSSLFFYSWWNIAYLPLILGSMLFNYIIGSSLNENSSKIKFSKKSVLAFGISANLLLLGYFKYYDFFITGVNTLLGSDIELLHLLLPLAISFFTFQQIAYLVDSYRGETKEYDFLNYAIFVTFFPQLIAGPIVHHKEMMPQFASKFNLVKKHKNIALGLFIFSIGLFKKVIIADNLAIMATNGFASSAALNTAEAWIASLSYTLQLYFDFSGYTDMAIGIALLFNIKLPINFNTPYKSTNIKEFWRRWHITLSRFLRDYIYIPLGGNRVSSARIYSNLMITFILGGLWHGAGLTFLFWGFLHGAALVIHRAWQNTGIKLNKFVAWFITFNFINISWVFFKASEFDQALNILKAMFIYKEINTTIHRIEHILSHLSADDKTASIFIFAFIASIFFKNSIELMRGFKPNYRYMIFILTIALASLLEMHQVTEFLYFNF
ncbi:MBOAT family O-acyltransferase [Sulfurimonas sp.]|uniref:MBOAT family O-acyltransferase n=1 Tax=Sulfurimonas sp. TaxID=2022749 RepID=UPI0019E9E1E4|nr:MBOAT family O-acyltransferase [Sulfurimonas sp.]MBE0514927.1 MBOAT family protein [Sulfurimonas sp.]